MSTPKRHALSITSAEFDARRLSKGLPTDAREGETQQKTRAGGLLVVTVGERQTDRQTDSRGHRRDDSRV